MKVMKIRVTFHEEVLGSQPADPEVHSSWIRSRAPEGADTSDEEELLPEADARGITVFHRDAEGRPAVLDYMWKGYFKDCCGMLRRVPGTSSKGLKAFKKEIDGLVFVEPRVIPFVFDGEMGDCQRPLRCATAQGERIALADSETVPAGATMEFRVKLYRDDMQDLVAEWLDYGADRGFGQWRNSGKGRFTWEEIG